LKEIKGTLLVTDIGGEEKKTEDGPDSLRRTIRFPTRVVEEQREGGKTGIPVSGKKRNQGIRLGGDKGKAYHVGRGGKFRRRSSVGGKMKGGGKASFKKTKRQGSHCPAGGGA